MHSGARISLNWLTSVEPKLSINCKYVININSKNSPTVLLYSTGSIKFKV